MSKKDWQLLEWVLEKIATKCGFDYLAASTGDSQLGGDGGGKFSLRGNELYWKFECKHRLSSLKKPVKLNELSDKVLDIMWQDKTNWPVVFCLFTPHHLLSDQLERKINALEKNRRIPFKIKIWDYKFLLKKIDCLLEQNEIRRIYPKISINNNFTLNELVLAGLVAEIENDTHDGLLIRNSYIQTEDISIKTINLDIKTHKLANNEPSPSKELYKINFLDLELEIERNLLEEFALTTIASKEKRMIEPNDKSSSPDIEQNAQTRITIIKTIDWDQRGKDIKKKKNGLIEFFQSLQNTKGDSLFSLIKKESDKSRLLIKVNINNFVLNLVPFTHLDKSDFGSSHQVDFQISNGK